MFWNISSWAIQFSTSQITFNIWSTNSLNSEQWFSLLKYVFRCFYTISQISPVAWSLHFRGWGNLQKREQYYLLCKSLALGHFQRFQINVLSQKLRWYMISICFFYFVLMHAPVCLLLVFPWSISGTSCCPPPKSSKWPRINAMLPYWCIFLFPQNDLELLPCYHIDAVHISFSWLSENLVSNLVDRDPVWGGRVVFQQPD